MKLSSALALFAATSISASAAPSIAPNISSWKAGVAAVHGSVKDQGDAGFCWANAWTSFLESKILIEKNRAIDLSAMYVARTHMTDGFVFAADLMLNGNEKLPAPKQGGIKMDPLNALQHYRDLRKNPVELAATQQMLLQRLQDLSQNVFEGFNFTDAYHYGAVPSSVYEKPAYDIVQLGPVAGAIPPLENRYISPSIEEKFQSFISNHLMNEKDMDQYLSDNGDAIIERQFDREIGNKPISRYDTFAFEGKKYSSRTFLRDFIGFDPSSHEMKDPQITLLSALISKAKGEKPEIDKAGFALAVNFDAVVDAIQGELDQRRPVLLGMTVMDDVNDPNGRLLNTGVMDPAYCGTPGQCQDVGGHAVMIVNSLKDSSGTVKAFIIQNSWGPVGTDENAVQTKVRANRGFDIVTLDYLKAAIKHRGYSFQYMMM